MSASQINQANLTLVASNACLNATPNKSKSQRRPLSQATELWFGIPKSGKTLGGSDEAFLEQAGYSITEKTNRIDDYILAANAPQAGEATIRTFIERPKDALMNIVDGGLDAAIVGRDVLKEVNATLPDNDKIKEVMDLNIASCVLTLAVEEDDNRIFSEFNQMAFATKYEDSLKKWLSRPNVNIAPSRIYVRQGGMEGMIKRYKDQGLIAIADIVESGDSLVKNGLKPYGITDAMWAQVKTGTRFADFPATILGKIPGVITLSRAVMVRTPKKLSPEKEAAFQTLAQRFYETAKQNGRKPRSKIKQVRPVQRVRDTGFMGHAAAWGLNY